MWRAYDLKLRQDVALKALRIEQDRDGEALDLEWVVRREALRQEVRVAREVISPNVCRVFDLQELDGQELISMEYVDGTTLQEVLKERSPLGAWTRRVRSRRSFSPAWKPSMTPAWCIATSSRRT